MSVYLDHNATSPVRPEAANAVARALSEGGNPSSVHASGRAAKKRLEAARETVAKAMCVRTEDLVFTSGGTEANNLAISGAAAAGAQCLVVSAIEHDAVAEAAAATGLPVEIWPVRPDGCADLDWLADRLNAYDPGGDGLALFALMAANNETGVIQPVEAAGRMIREAGALFHVDAVQALGKTGFDFAGSMAHFAAVSAHKIGGPQGVGALALACDAPSARLLHGGGQEKGRRGGTENLPGVIGFAAAIEALGVSGEAERAEQGRMRDRAEALIRDAAPQVRIWGADVDRLSNTLCLSTPGWASEIQVIALDLAGFEVSAGAACSSGKVRKSRVLEAMGATPDHAESTLRVSFGWTNTINDAQAFAKAWAQAYEMARPKAAAAV